MEEFVNSSKSRANSKELSRLTGKGEAEEFVNRSRSRANSKELSRLTRKGKAEEIDILNPEKCCILKQIPNDLNSGDEEERFLAICRFKNVFNGMIMQRGSAACATYASYVLSQKSILEEIIRGLREFQESGKCYLVPRDAKIPGNFYLVGKVCMYSNILTSLSLDKRASRFIQRQFKDVVAVQISNYSAVTIPEEFRSRSSIQPGDDEELYSKMMILNSFTFLRDKQLGKNTSFLKGTLPDILEASKHDRYRDIATSALSSMLDYCPQLADGSEDLLLTVSSRILETTQDQASVHAAIHVIAAVTQHNPSYFRELHGHSSLATSLLALVLSNCTNPLKILVPGMLRWTRQEMMEIIGHYDASSKGLTSEQLKKLESLASADKLVMRRRKEFDSIFAWKPAENLREEAGASTQEDQPRGFEKIMKVERHPCRKCSNSSCMRVEGKPQEFKVCGQCRLASYCSTGEDFETR